VTFRPGGQYEYLNDEELEYLQRESGLLAAKMVQEAYDEGRLGDADNPTARNIERMKTLIGRAETLTIREIEERRKK